MACDKNYSVLVDANESMTSGLSSSIFKAPDYSAINRRVVITGAVVLWAVLLRGAFEVAKLFQLSFFAWASWRFHCLQNFFNYLVAKKSFGFCSLILALDGKK